jgi:hypothetical protein
MTSNLLFLLAMIPPVAASSGAGNSLVPSAPGTSPGYWCTWASQNYAVDLRSLDNATGLGDHRVAADNLTEGNVFGDPGWASRYLGAARADLFLMFDVGWDVVGGTPFDRQRWLLGSFEVAVDKFPSCAGAPVERLRRLNALTRAHGWRGAALWVPAHAYGDRGEGPLDREATAAFFRERAAWCREAGIQYWKVDYGTRGDAAFRAVVSEAARSVHPGLIIEHSRGGGPLNDEECPWDVPAPARTGRFEAWGDGEVAAKSRAIAAVSGVFRTYDVTAHLSVPTTLDRAGSLLAGLTEGPGREAILNVEDEVYVAAALGCALGVMRHPLWGEFEGRPYDPHDLRRRTQEVVRAVRWQRLGPALAAGVSPVGRDLHRLEDDWVFRAGDSWVTWLFGRRVVQSAPARTVRGMPLSAVTVTEGSPFVAATRWPNGAVALAVLPRMSSAGGLAVPAAEVRVSGIDVGRPVGVFGRPTGLTLEMSTPGPWRVLAQDLAAEVSEDVTAEIQQDGVRLRVPGTLLERLCRNPVGDVSDPGVVITVEVVANGWSSR